MGRGGQGGERGVKVNNAKKEIKAKPMREVRTF